MLSDPRPALTEQSDFHHLLVGLAGLGELVRSLAGPPPDGPKGRAVAAGADELVHVLLGLASLGDAVGGMASAPAPVPPPHTPAEPVRWLR